MLSLQTVVPHTLELLKQIMSVPLFSSLRLVGGTALALQYGHRSSVDLDFFGELEKDTDSVTLALENLGDVIKGNCTDSIKAYHIDGIKTDFVNYSCYPWIDNPIIEEGIRLASPKDIAAMKINAIMGRGSRKDFVDMHFLLKNYSLDEILGFYQQKYSNASIFRALLSLTYFNDADLQPMPEMFVDTKWDEMKESIITAVDEYNKKSIQK